MQDGHLVQMLPDPPFSLSYQLELLGKVEEMLGENLLHGDGVVAEEWRALRLFGSSASNTRGSAPRCCAKLQALAMGPAAWKLLVAVARPIPDHLEPMQSIESHCSEDPREQVLHICAGFPNSVIWPNEEVQSDC